MDLMQASNQWANRPADQRFWNLNDLLEATIAHRKASQIGTANLLDLRVEPAGGEIALVGNSHLQAFMSYWAFGQLCVRVGAPASYLRQLPPALACENLSYGLKHTADAVCKILLNQNGGLVARAIVSESYSRIWNYELVDRLRRLGDGWRVPPARPAFANQPGSRPATAQDILERRFGGGGLSVNVGDMIAPAGLYASFEDMFVFMVNEQARINDGTPEGLSRGFFMSNSEVGKSAFKLTTFFYRHVCGNHIVWSASGVKELNLRHVGDANSRFGPEMELELRRYSDASAAADEAKIAEARRFRLAAGKQSVIDMIFQHGILSRSRADQAYQLAEVANEDPESAWGLAQGVTRMSQSAINADSRVELDRAAGKIIDLAF